APTDILDCFKLVPEMHNLADRFQCPGIILSDLLLSEGRASVDPKDLDFNVEIDRGELITSVSVGPTGQASVGTPPSAASLIGHSGRSPHATADSSNSKNGYKRYQITEKGITPRSIPGKPAFVHTGSNGYKDAQ